MNIILTEYIIKPVFIEQNKIRHREFIFSFIIGSYLK
jgi:hypothetical protein